MNEAVVTGKPTMTWVSEISENQRPVDGNYRTDSYTFIVLSDMRFAVYS